MMNEQPRIWAESLLVAYVDGQLDAAQAKAVEDALREDAEARAIVSVLRSSASAVKHAYDDALSRPLPAGLQNLFADMRRDATEGVANISPVRAHHGIVQRFLPLAASIMALMIGFAAGYAMFGDRGGRYYVSGDGDERTDLFQAALQQALEATDVGASQIYMDDGGAISGKVTVIGPVATANLGTCREFQHDAVSNDTTETSFGIACRDTRGNWLIETEQPAGG